MPRVGIRVGLRFSHHALFLLAMREQGVLLALLPMKLKSFYYRLRALGLPFWLLWMGESISMFGTQMVQFALGVWIYEKTHSVLSFAGSLVASLLPALLVMPIAGAVVDRLDRRYIVIISDCLSVLVMLTMLLLLHFDRLAVPHLYGFAAVASMLGAFQGPAYQAVVANVVRKDLLTRAAGAMGVSSSSLGIIAPTVAGTLLAAVGLSGMVLLDLATFVLGTALVWRAFSLAKMSKPSKAMGGLWAAVRSSLDHFTESMVFFERDPRMLSLLVYSLVQSAMIAMAVSMVVPLILANHPAKSLGVIMSFGAGGALLGSLVMVVLDAPGRRMAVLLGCDAIFAVCIALTGVVTSIEAYCAVEFVAGVSGAIAASCATALWMERIPDTQRGSVMVLVSSTAMFSTAAMVLFGGVAVDRVLEPALTSGGNLLASIGQWLGVPNKGKGVAFLFVLAGTLGLFTSLCGLAFRPLRQMR